MSGRLFRIAALSAAAMLASGCVQATRHSNTMIFGTSTTVGFKAGTNVTEIPEVILAYDRQEAVIMPLWANAGQDSTDGMGRRAMTPCDPKIVNELKPEAWNKLAVHPCSFLAYRNGTIDSYSVLASFGASFDGGASNRGTEQQANAGAGLAQYFATGMAAQTLAQTGGAALVNTSAAAAATGSVATYREFRTAILAHLATLDDPATVAFLKNFEGNLGFTVLAGDTPACSTQQGCSRLIAADIYLPRHSNGNLNKALDDLI